MTLRFFFENYNLQELNIIDVYSKNKTLSLKIALDTHLELIANGYRPEMNLENIFTFNFEVDNDVFVSKPYKVNEYKFEANRIIITINLSKIILNRIKEISLG